ncbi:hypothetical protein L3X38_021550 [Prunus dulcis]|uniref:Uncharacterized protein n=1 Tax=Prunus dulcis TaxID=3755 RepID=A0AAD4VUB4_PRUDU|nr:hypothetical protein L3X38_021550 [Prunus dulcis]
MPRNLNLASGSLVKSLFNVSIHGRLVVGGGDKVAIFDVATMTADKTNVKPLSKNGVRFEIVRLTFDLVVENYVAVGASDV